jgi:hypothetical protein
VREEITDKLQIEAIEGRYQKMIAASKEGPEAVQKAMRELSPGKEWMAAAWDLIDERQATRPRFLYGRPDESTRPWSPAEDALEDVGHTSGLPLLRRRLPALGKYYRSRFE